MVFLETPVFTRQIKTLVDDGQYLELQALLMVRPDAGNLIPGSGGLRKIRMRVAGRGKRGGARVVYYWMKDRSQIYMLLVYPKNEQADLRKEEIRMLSELVRQELG
jgi:mRNA-degrading endonuclease RelE of RelBE toxin-antitoxin system